MFFARSLWIGALTAGTLVAQQPPPAPPAPAPKKPPARQKAPVAPRADLWLEPSWLPELSVELPSELSFELHSLPELQWQLGDLAYTLQDLDLHLPDLSWELSEVRVELPDLAPLDLAWAPDLPGTGLVEPSARGQGRATPEDSLYRQARETLNRGEYRRSLELFRTFEQRYARSRYVPSAMYWQAFALYRIGAEADLRAALAVLEQQRARYAEAAAQADVLSLHTRIAGALASRGDAQAAAALRGAANTAQACDREDMSVRAEALSALVQADPAGSREVLRRTLARRDPCSAPLRRRALYLLARDPSEDHTAELVKAAREDPEAEVRSDAVSQLARLSGDQAEQALQTLFGEVQDERTQRTILSNLARRDTPSANQFLRKAIERGDLSETLRVEAIRGLASRRSSGSAALSAAVRAAAGLQDEERARLLARSRQEGEMAEADAEYLRSLYGRVESRRLKEAVLDGLARAGGKASDDWLMGIVRNPSEELRLRAAAAQRLRRSDLPVADLSQLYDALSDRDLRSIIISALGARSDDAATDKLIEIAKSGTDPSLRRQAISALTRKNDPRTTKLLLELVEKP